MNLFRRPFYVLAAAALVFGASAMAQQTPTPMPPKPVPTVATPAAVQVPVRQGMGADGLRHRSDPRF
jgi:hypothetical protein